MERKIIVFGATGNTGIKICEELNSINLNHSAFVRAGSEGKVNTPSTVIVEGNVFNKTNIESAFEKQYYTDVIIALGSRDLNDQNVRSTGTKHIVDALKESNTHSKLHVISAHGVGDSWDRLRWYEKLLSNLFLGKTMKDHTTQEEYAKSNSGGWHIIRPVALKNGSKSGKINEQTGGQLPESDITRADVANYLVESMLSNKRGANSICKG